MTGDTVRLAPPTRADRDVFLAAVQRSGELHGDWVDAPADAAAYDWYVLQGESDRADFSLVWHKDGLVGAVNLSELIRGRLQQGYMGFYAFEPLAGRGLMTQGVRLAVRRAFDTLGLHRVEANVQPGNHRSIALVRRAGFHKEGFSPRYLHIAGAWRDHERWAAIAD